MVTVEVAHHGCNFRPYKALLVSERQHEIIEELVLDSDHIGSPSSDLYGHAYSNSHSGSTSPTKKLVHEAEKNLLPLISESGETVSKHLLRRAELLNEIASSSGDLKASMQQGYEPFEKTSWMPPKPHEGFDEVIDQASLIAEMRKMLIEAAMREITLPSEQLSSKPVFDAHAKAHAQLLKRAEDFKATASDAAEERRRGTGSILRWHFGDEKMVKHVHAVMDDVDEHVYAYAKALSNVQENRDVEAAYVSANIPAYSQRAAYSRAEELRIGLDAQLFKVRD